MNDLGERLKKIRLKNNLSLSELAERLNKHYDLNISKSMISRWENNKAEPYNTYLSAYAKEFSVSLNYLLGLDDDDSYKPSPEIDDRLVVLARNAKDLTDDQIEFVEDLIKHLSSQNKE